jgi:hypothetical protein
MKNKNGFDRAGRVFGRNRSAEFSQLVFFSGIER